jgi:DNA-binding response OmpR family regulator
MVPTREGQLPSAFMADVLIASDSVSLHNEIRSLLTEEGTTVRAVNTGALVRPTVADRLPDLVIADLQIGNMGGVAVSLDLRLEEGAGRLGHVPILLLLDRRADVFVARRAQVDGWLVKPIEPIRLRRAVQTLLNGGTYFDDAYRPQPVLATTRSSTIDDSGK